MKKSGMCFLFVLTKTDFMLEIIPSEIPTIKPTHYGEREEPTIREESLLDELEMIKLTWGLFDGVVSNKNSRPMPYE